MRFFKVVIYNFFVFLFLIIILEIIFGYWFKEENFGIYMRKERKINWQTTSFFNGKEYNFFYKRNFYGFRGDEFEPKNVQIIFEGGSTGNQRYHPEELTIVGFLNEKFKSVMPDINIYNASTDGKSITGYINDFKFWFTKIKDFKPEYVIFYLGINDRFLSDRYFDYKISEKKIDQIKDYIKNNSFFVDKFKQIKNKYFPKNTMTYDFGNETLYENYKYINYSTALSLHSKLDDKDLILIENLKSKLFDLKKIIDIQNFQPIFITQVKYDGLKDKKLFLINNEIKDFAIQNDYFLISLDEILEMNINDFYDTVHTTPVGSKKIAEAIFPKLLNFLE
tara:strand:+ start:266 stop:1273 length:1008 start_codon:yes stop_codon:yes gene_type:complete